MKLLRESIDGKGAGGRRKVVRIAASVGAMVVSCGVDFLRGCCEDQARMVWMCP